MRLKVLSRNGSSPWQVFVSGLSYSVSAFCSLLTLLHNCAQQLLFVHKLIVDFLLLYKLIYWAILPLCVRITDQIGMSSLEITLNSLLLQNSSRKGLLDLLAATFDESPNGLACLDNIDELFDLHFHHF